MHVRAAGYLRATSSLVPAARCVNGSRYKLLVTLEDVYKRQRIAYTSALPVGSSSTADYFDVYLTELIPAEDALARLQAAAPVDLRPIDSAYVELRRPALTAEIRCV